MAVDGRLEFIEKEMYVLLFPFPNLFLGSVVGRNIANIPTSVENELKQL
jgi:hypothetical protein